MGLTVAVVSGKGGTGKSTFSCGLALALNSKGKSVALIDFDAGLPCLDIFFGVEESVVFNLFDAISNNSYDDALYFPEKFGGSICIVPAPPKDFSLSCESIADFVEYCNQKFDAVIIDMPAGLEFSALKSVKNLKAVCVTNCDTVSVRDAFMAETALCGLNLKPLLVINKFDAELVRNKTYKNIDDIIDGANIRLLGIVPLSYDLMLLQTGKKLKKRSKAFKALLRISDRLYGKTVLLPNPKKI